MPPHQPFVPQDLVLRSSG